MRAVQPRAPACAQCRGGPGLWTYSEWLVAVAICSVGNAVGLVARPAPGGRGVLQHYLPSAVKAPLAVFSGKGCGGRPRQLGTIPAEVVTLAACSVAAQLVLNDVTLDDLWRLDLKKLHGWECINENTAGAPRAPGLPSAAVFGVCFCASGDDELAWRLRSYHVVFQGPCGGGRVQERRYLRRRSGSLLLKTMPNTVAMTTARRTDSCAGGNTAYERVRTRKWRRNTFVHCFKPRRPGSRLEQAAGFEFI